MNRCAGFALFILGAVVGVGCTWCFAKRKYETIANEEIESVKETFARGRPSAAPEKPELSEYVRSVANYRGEQPEPDISAKRTSPYVISPEEFSEDDIYTKLSFVVYANGILTDDKGDPVENFEMFVGTDWQNCFGKYEEDSVHVRNDERKCDYEILLDSKNY